MIWSSATGSAITSGAACCIATCGSTPLFLNSGSSKYSALFTASCRLMRVSSAVRSGRSMARRSRPTTSDARRACSAAWVMARRAVSSSGGSSASRRAAAWVLASRAVRGWFSSCAMPAASSPRVLSRATWPRRSSSSARWRSARWRCQAKAAASKAATSAPHAAIQAHGSSAQPTCRSA